MLQEYEKLLTLEPKASALLNYYLVIVHLLALFAVWYANINLLLAVLLTFFIVIEFSYLKFKSYGNRKIIWLQNNSWKVYADVESYDEACLTPWSFLSSWLIILVFKTHQGKVISILLPYDTLGKESFRRLKLRLMILKPKYLRDPSTDNQ